MFAHAARDAASCRSACCHVSAVCYVCTPAKLIGAQIVGAEDLSALIGDEGLAVRSRPIREPVVLAHVARQCVIFSRPDGRLKDLPNRVVIVLRSGPNEQHLPLVDVKDKILYPGGREVTLGTP